MIRMRENDPAGPAEDSFRERIRRSSYWILAGKMLTPTITFVMTAYIVKKLTVDEFGIYNFLFALTAYIGLFSSLGMLHVYKRFIPEFRHKGEFAHVRRLVRSGSLLRGTLTTAMVAAVLLFSEGIGRLFRVEDLSLYLMIFSMAILFHLESQLIGVALVSLFLHKYFVIAQTVYAVARAGLLVLLLESGRSLRGLLAAEVAAYGILLGLQYLFYHRASRGKGNSGAGTGFPKRRILRFAGYSYFNEMGEQVLDVSTDLFVISAFLGVEMVGLYAFANKVVDLITRWLPHRLLMDVIGPTFHTNYVKNHHNHELAGMFALLLKFVAFFSLPVVVLLVVLGDKIILYVFDPEYLGALHVMWVVAAFVGLKSIHFPLFLTIQASEKTEINLYSKAFAVYNLLGDLLVVRRFGILGVAVVTGSAVLFKNIFIYFMLKRHVPLRFDVPSMGRIAGNSLVLGILLYLSRGLVQNVLLLCAAAAAGGAVFLGISYLRPSFSEEERSVINRVLPRSWFLF